MISLFSAFLIVAFLSVMAGMIVFVAVRSKYEHLRTENAELKKELAVCSEKNKWLEEADKKLRETFDSLAAKALRDNTDHMLGRTRDQLEGFIKELKGNLGSHKQEFKSLVEPLERELAKLDSQVRQMEEKREGAYESLKNQINNLTDAHRQLQDAAITLSQALKSSSVRAKWGELQLRRIAEMAGMTNHVDFAEQVQSAEGSRPDMIIYLPNSGIIPVDSKAPMSAYLDALEEKSQEGIEKKMKEHARSLRNHMRSLAQKAYWSQFKECPQFVVMLVPYESGLSAAFTNDPDLLEDALANKVIIVSPATLLALLKVVAIGWLQLELAQNARDIAEQGRALSDRIDTFLKHFKDVGSKISSLMDTYNKAAGSMEKRVLPSIRKLKEMGAGSEDIPEISQVENSVRLVEVGEE